MRRVLFATTGWIHAPKAALAAGIFGKIRIPIVVAICERDDGSIWLVDAGFSKQVCEDPRSALGFLQGRTIAASLQPHDALVSQMRAAAINPDRVTTILATHLHLDHISGCADFPNAELITTHDELTFARRAGSLLGYRLQDLDVINRIRLVSLASDEILGFAKSFRFDDEIAALDARGHSRGHLAVVIRHGEQTYLHAGDAAYQSADYRDNVISPLARLVAQDKAALHRTYDLLRQCENLPRPPLIVLSHDASSFERLPTVSRLLSP